MFAKKIVVEKWKNRKLSRHLKSCNVIFQALTKQDQGESLRFYLPVQMKNCKQMLEVRVTLLNN
jgi:hypothetical protein